MLPAQGPTAASDLSAARGAVRPVADANSGLLGQQIMGLGALNASNQVLTGSASRPAGMPMAVP